MSFSEPVLILCIMVWGISRGSDVVSGELGRGTMEMLLSRPVGRVRLMAIHTGICVVGLALLCGCAWLGLYAGINTNSINETLNPTINFRLPFVPIDVPIPSGAPQEIATPLSKFVQPNLYTLPCINLFAFGFFILAISTLLSSLDRYRWRTIGVVIGFYVIQLLVFLLSKTIASMRFLQNITFLSSYQPDAIVHYVQKHPESAWALLAPESTKSAVWPHLLGPLGLSLLLILVGTLLIGYAMFYFRRRDLPAPL
jgi:ABC-2 type transport system permease protein